MVIDLLIFVISVIASALTFSNLSYFEHKLESNSQVWILVFFIAFSPLIILMKIIIGVITHGY
jgi:hypothetical protein